MRDPQHPWGPTRRLSQGTLKSCPCTRGAACQGVHLQGKWRRVWARGVMSGDLRLGAPCCIHASRSKRKPSARQCYAQLSICQGIQRWYRERGLD